MYEPHDHGRGAGPSHGHGHGHGGLHAAMCGGVDHHSGSYTPQQRADLDRVLAFNRRMAGAIDAGLDVSAVERHLDPDPLRYMWVDEGQGRIAAVIAEAHGILDRAPRLGHVRAAAEVLPGSARASRPAVAVGPGGLRLVAWTEWVPQQGDLLHAALGDGPPEVVDPEVADVFRPTAAVTTDGEAWVFWAVRRGGATTVHAAHRTPAGWSAPEPVSAPGELAFNQEVVALPGGGLEVCWQGRDGERFAIFSRRRTGGTWGPVTRVSAGTEANVWDPALAVLPGGGAAYAWSEYAGGAYRVVVRRRDAAGRLGDPQPVSAGSDYALHPHLAVTADGRLWCAFDVITVAGHGGSGPTRLRPASELPPVDGRIPGMREPGDSVPPELLPEVSASLRVVQVLHGAVAPAPGDLAPRLDVVPSGMPKLVATPDNGLAVAYRVHRRLPLMTYYWEVAVQALTPSGWGAPTTLHGTDGTLEEVAVAAGPGGFVVAAQTDGRLEHALAWTEGFGGRECPYLMEHQGSVVWHGVHGIGAVTTTEFALPGPAPAAGTGEPVVRADSRVEARRWVGAGGERYTAALPGREYQLYWGDLHRHSLVSRCTAGDEPSLEDFYRYAWDVCEYDFWAVTDHSENSSDHQWWSIQKIADLFHVPGRFVPLYGFEWTSADHGHQNVVYGDVPRGAPIFSAFAAGTTDPVGLWAGLERHGLPAITIPHHPGSAMVRHDWDHHHPEYSALVEVFQACRGNYEAPGAFRQYSDAVVDGTFTLDGLRRGHRFGLIASSDHGHGAAYVGCFATGLDRAGIFEGLRSRRTFAATTRDVLVVLRATAGGGTAFMGEELAADRAPTLTVHAEGYTDLARVEVVRDGDLVHAWAPARDLPAGWSEVPLRLEWGGSDTTTVWDGALTVDGGEVVPTAFVAPEVLAVSERDLLWRNTTHSFGELYGAQRGGFDVSLAGPPQARVTVRVAGAEASFTLAELAAGTVTVPVPAGHFRIQHGTGGLGSLGTRELDLRWTDPAGPPAATTFYYVRVLQVDGEMAWSSPIWITTTAGAQV